MTSTLFIYLFAWLTYTAFSDLNHDFHLSKCDIVYDDETSAFQITIHIFIDDLELALSREGHDDLYLCTNKEVGNADELIGAYIEQKLKIVVDQDTIDYTFLGKELSDDLFAMWCYLEKSEIYPEDQIEVGFDLLMETFNDQRNIVKLEMDKKNKTHFLFDRKINSGLLTLK